MPTFRPTLIVFAASALLASTSLLLFAQQPYQIIDRWKVGGSGGWDYLLADSPSHLLYLTHGSRVEVIDTTTGKAVAAITGMKGTHGIALDDSGTFGYISDGGNNSVVVFDRHTYKMVATVPAGTNPDGIVFEPATRTVWAFNGRSNNVTVLDAATNKVVSTLEVPGKPEFPVADGLGSVYDNIESRNELVRFDARTRKITATWPLTNCESPSGLAMDSQHRRLFAVCDGNKMAVVDADSGKQLASPEIGGSPDAASFSPTRQLAFSSNGTGTLTIIDAGDNYRVVENLATALGARTMSYNDLTDRAFLVTAQRGPAPAPTKENPHPRPTIVPDTFEVLEVGRNK
jgi:YVTN family beta-propeller protein